MTPLTRRGLLRAGISLCPLLLPFVRRTEAVAASALPKRFVLFQTANGFPREELWGQSDLPETKGLEATHEMQMAFGEGVFQPLAAHHDRMLLARGLYNPFDIDLHGNVFASLSLRERPAEGQPGGISLDRYVGQQLGKTDAFSSIAVAPVWHKSDAFSRAADGSSAPFPAEVLPQDAFDNYFGAAVGENAELKAAAEARIQRRTSILDFAQDDVSLLRSRTSGWTREQLDQYLESLRQVEQQVSAQAAVAANCDADQAPLAEFEPTQDPTDEHIEAMLDVSFQALGCGLTRVANISLGTSDGKISHYGFRAIAHQGSHHKYEHESDMAALADISNYVHQKIAGFLDRLQQVPEGDKTMLDNTLVLVVNDGGGKHHNGQDDIPLLWFGDAAGALRSGRIISYPLQTRSTADAFVSTLHALGINDETFGDESINRGPLTELG